MLVLRRRLKLQAPNTAPQRGIMRRAPDPRQHPRGSDAHRWAFV